MTTTLKESAKRVQDYLADNGFPFEVKEFETSTRTAQQAADSIGCTLAQIAKSLVFKIQDSETPVLVIASGSNRVDIKKIEQATGLKLSRADGNFVKRKVGYAIGGVPPVGHSESLKTIMDPDLKKYDVIWAAAGTPFAVFKLTPSDLERLTDGVWIELAE